MAALLDEGKKFNLGSVAHLDQMGVVRMNARDAVRLGLGTVTHYYGLFESLLQGLHPPALSPSTHNYNDEAEPLRPGGPLWDKIYPRGSKEWNDLLDEFVGPQGLPGPHHDHLLSPAAT